MFQARLGSARLGTCPAVATQAGVAARTCLRTYSLRRSSAKGAVQIFRSSSSHGLAGLSFSSCQLLRSSVIPRAQAGGGSSGSGSGGSSGGGGSGGSDAAGGGGDATPHPLRNWTWAYAAFLAVGGTIAFVKAGSQKSLTSAMGAALILTLSARKMMLGSARGSIAVCLAISVFLSIIMAGRYSRSRKVMPAGMTAAASIGMSAAYIFSLIA